MKAECSRRKLRVRVYHTPHINVASLIQRGEGGREMWQTFSIHSHTTKYIEYSIDTRRSQNVVEDVLGMRFVCLGCKKAVDQRY